MTKSRQGFSIDLENAKHLIKIRLWGRWDIETGERYVRECRQKLSRIPAHDDESWSVLLDLIGYVLPSQEAQTYIEQGFMYLRSLTVTRQAILLHGPIVHLPGQSAPQTGTCVSSYFQSGDEAIEWLLDE